MHSNIDELSGFYQGKLGRLVANCVKNSIRTSWHTPERLEILGLGYASPFLESFTNDTNRIVNLIPSEMGFEKWPNALPNKTVIADENNLPFADNCFDRVICIHAIEGAQNPRKILRELWRVTKDEGTLIFFVTNRRSAWARWDITPFGHSRPYSQSQITKLLEEAMFEVLNTKKVLTFPPFEIGLSEKNAERWEVVGKKLWPALGGLVMVSAKKRLFNGVFIGSAKPKLNFSHASASFLNNSNQKSTIFVLY